MEIDSIGLHLPSHKMGGQGRKAIITYNSPKRYRRCQEPDFPTEERLRLSTTSQSASQTAPLVGEPLAKPFTLRGLPKPPLGRGGGSASALTERLSPAVAYGQALLRTTSQSASQTAPLVGEPLAKPFTLRGLPKPPLGRSNGDDRRQWRKQGGAVGAAASRMRAAAKQTLGAATRAVSRRSRDGEVELLSQRESLCLRGLREFVENARLKRKEFVNVIKMRRRY